LNLRRIRRYGCLALVGLVGVPLIWRTWVGWNQGRHIYPSDQVRPERVAVVFGARVYPDGRLSPMLRDRVETAVQLYHAGKVDRLLLSGDNRFSNYDEPGRMAEYAVERGVPEAAIQTDYGGRRTYDTCYRAKDIFGLQSAILVTQRFHLPRALYTCRQIGLNAVGVAADLQPYARRSLVWSELREVPALLAAAFDVARRAPPPVLGDRIPIP